MNKTQESIYEVITSNKLTYEQKLKNLAGIAENELDVLPISEKTAYYFSTGAINDLFEGHAPYRPRYVMPDYDRYLRNGSEFLRVKPPKALDEAIFALMMLYHRRTASTKLVRLTKFVVRLIFCQIISVLGSSQWMQ